MTIRAAHCAPQRATGAFLPAVRYSCTRCPGAPLRRFSSVRTCALEGFQPDSRGAASPSSSASATSSTASQPSAGDHHPAAPLLPPLALLASSLRNHAMSLAHHLSTRELPAFVLNPGQGLGLLGLEPAGHLSAGQAGLAHSPPSAPSGPCNHEQQQPNKQFGRDERAAASGGISLVYLPWSSKPQGSSAAASASHTPSGGPSGTTTITAATTTTAPTSRTGLTPWGPEPTPPLVLLLLLGPSGVQAVVAARLSGLSLMWHSAVSLQQRAVLTALWHVGQAVETAERARRSMPPPREVPGLMHWGATTAAVRVEETVVLALAHTAAAASAAAAGVPAATAAVTGSAAVAAAAATVAAPHLPLLHHTRRRLLAAATGLLERLRGLQRGCTTHVLLRFLLFSAVNPVLRRDLLTRLDVLARRAAQLALLQKHHDAWVAGQLQAHSPALQAAVANRQPPSSGMTATLSASSSEVWTPHSVQSAAGAATSALSARWYRNVFVAEMRACARQLRCAAPSPLPGDRAAGDPPGRFDLRDLYRLIRVLEVAVEDLERGQ